MKRFLCNPSHFLMLIALLLAACATTQINAVWKDPSYHGRPHRVMVVGMAKSPVNRRIFEDEFVRQFKARGVDAIASYTVLPDKKENDQAAIARKVDEQGADAVLITRLVSKKIEKFYVPGQVYYPPHQYGHWRDYYGYGYDAIYTPGYMAENAYAVMETNLYDAENDSLIWTASSQTVIRGADQNRIKSFIDIMVNSMAGQGLLGK